MSESTTAEEVPVAPEGAPAAEVEAANRYRMLLWGGALLLLINFAAPGFGLVTLPIAFFLKNKLHLTASGLAAFNFWTGIPLYASFAFGLFRDRWNPFGRGDRGHLVLFGAASATIFTGMAFAPPTYASLFVGVVAVTMTLNMVASAANGVVSTIGKQQVMAGQMSIALLLANAFPTVASYLLGGALSQVLEGQTALAAARALFLVAAGLNAAIALFGARGPTRLFDAGREKEEPTLGFFADVARLARFWPVWPALIVQLLWQFGPALGVVMQYHLANALKFTDGQVGVFYAIFFAALTPSYLLYGWLCRRVRLSGLLWWGAASGVPQMIPLLAIHSVASAYWVAIPVGLMGGFATAAFMDLTIRSSPKGLEGTMMMLITGSAYWIANRGGDLWGTDLYDRHGGFVVAVWATTAVYALMPLVLFLVPRRLIATADGEAAITA